MATFTTANILKATGGKKAAPTPVRKKGPKRRKAGPLASHKGRGTAYAAKTKPRGAKRR
jgi:hypothetical protein